MAIRRATQKQQVIEKLSEQAPAGEQFIACVHTETGPSPWLNAIFDRIPFVGLFVALSRKYYFFTLTNTSVLVNGANRFTNRPGEVVAVFSRHQFPVTNYNRAAVWSKFYVHFPEAKKPTRLNVHRYWRAELDQLAAAFPAGQAVPAQDPGNPALGLMGLPGRGRQERLAVPGPRRCQNKWPGTPCLANHSRMNAPYRARSTRTTVMTGASTAIHAPCFSAGTLLSSIHMNRSLITGGVIG